MWARRLIIGVPLYHDSVFANLKDHVAQFYLVDRLCYDASLAVDHEECGAPNQHSRYALG